jgi:hypothetical protein
MVCFANSCPEIPSSVGGLHFLASSSELFFHTVFFSFEAVLLCFVIKPSNCKVMRFENLYFFALELVYGFTDILPTLGFTQA